MMKSDWNRPQKNEMRQIVTRCEGKTYRCILVMPGKQCLCVKSLMANGAIDHDTVVVAIERDGAIASKIGMFLSENFAKYSVVNAEIERITADDLRMIRRFDFVYLDTCISLNPALATWLALLPADLFSLGATIWTAWTHYRHPVWQSMMMTLFASPAEQLKAFSKLCAAYKDVGEGKGVGAAIASALAGKRNTFENALLVFEVLKRALKSEVQEFYIYRDGTTYMMVARQGACSLPMEGERTDMGKGMGKVDWHLAGLKAWAKRCHRAAGRKAWQTRQRRAAALKAWQTRRLAAT